MTTHDRLEPEREIVVVHPDEVDSDSAPGESREREIHAQASATKVMPGTPEENLHDIAAESPEGVPADPQVGPARLRSMVWWSLAMIAVAAGLSAIWLGWGGALAVLGVGVLAMAVNPVVGATLLRMQDRERVIEHRTHK